MRFDLHQSANAYVPFHACSQWFERETSMSDAVQDKQVFVQARSGEGATQVQPALPEKKTGMSSTDKIVWGTLILGFAAVVLYQIFFCPTCYVGGGRVVG
jgi:hypothetical protein